MMKPFLILLLFASSAIAADTYTPAPLRMIAERVDEHDQQICDIQSRLERIEKILTGRDSTKIAGAVVPTRSQSVSAAAIVAKTTPAAPVIPTARRLKTLSELRSEIAANRTSRVYATVSPNTLAWVTMHLVNDHGFTSSQVSGLSHDEAWMLHNLAHPNIITPYTSGGPVQRAVARAETFTPRLNIPTANNGGCPNGRCPTSRGAVQQAATWYPGKLIFGR